MGPNRIDCNCVSLTAPRFARPPDESVMRGAVVVNGSHGLKFVVGAGFGQSIMAIDWKEP